MSNKLRVGILGATGMVGQRFIQLLDNHPWFEVVAVAASPRSAGRTYEAAVSGRWKMTTQVPQSVRNLVVKSVEQLDVVCADVDFLFSAVDMSKDEIRKVEEYCAKLETPVVSNNSAHRWTEDVPMVIPEINEQHFEIIAAQKARLGTKNGFIAVKPNCSIQSYVPALHPLAHFGIKAVSVCTFQAISGAGKTFDDFPEIIDNVIPFIGGEEEKSETEPLKIWGSIAGGKIVKSATPGISAQCIRVPASDGHLAAVSVSFENKPTKDEILKAWSEFSGAPQQLNLPSAPKQFIKYFEEDNRPQTKLDRDYENGMGITVGRLRDDNVFDYKFVCLSHNTLRGAAGGAVLIAELLKDRGYIKNK